MTRTSDPDFEEGTLNAYVVTGNEVSGGDRYGYKVVAIIYESWNGWGVFSGPTSWSDKQVGMNGDAVREEVARLLFPTLAATGRFYSA